MPRITNFACVALRRNVTWECLLLGASLLMPPHLVLWRFSPRKDRLITSAHFITDALALFGRLRSVKILTLDYALRLAYLASDLARSQSSQASSAFDVRPACDNPSVKPASKTS